MLSQHLNAYQQQLRWAAFELTSPARLNRNPPAIQTPIDPANPPPPVHGSLSRRKAGVRQRVVDKQENLEVK